MIKYTLNKKSGPQLFGRITTPGDFTIEFNLQSNWQTDSLRQATLAESKYLKIYISYPYVYFETYNHKMKVLLIDYEQIRPFVPDDGSYSDARKITFALNRSQKIILINGVTAGEVTGSFARVIDEDLYISSGTEIDALTGIVEVTWSSNYITYAPKLPVRAYDEMEFHPKYVPGSFDYKNVPRAIDQIKQAPPDVFKSDIPQLSIGFNLRYVVGMGNEPLTTAELFKRVVDLQRELCKRNYAIRFSDAAGETYDEVINNKPCLSREVAVLVREFPNARLDVTSAWAHIGTANGITPVDITRIKPSTPLSALDNDRNIYQKYGQVLAALAKSLGVKIGFHYENNEHLIYTNASNETEQATNSQAYQRQVNYVLELFRQALADLKFSSEYDIHFAFWNLLYNSFSERIKISTNGMGTVSIYCEHPGIWYDHEGAQRGIGFYLASKEQEIKTGHPFNIPFVSGGWSAKEEDNLGFPQLLAIYKILFGAGADTAVPSYFTLTGRNSTGFQQDQSYAYQLLAASKAQSVFSDPEVRDLVVNGDLLSGDIFQQYVNSGHRSFWTGSKAIKTVVRKHKTLNKYLIVTAHMPLSRYTSNVKKGLMTSITIGNEKITFKSRRQGCVYIYEPGKPLRWFDRAHQNTHIGRWS